MAGKPKGTPVTRMLAARKEMDRASAEGDTAGANRAFAVFDAARRNATRDQYLDLYPDLSED